MMRVVALSPFYDTVELVNRAAGDEFDVTKERFEAINKAGMEQLGANLVNKTVKEPLSPKGKEASKETAKKRKTSKKD